MTRTLSRLLTATLLILAGLAVAPVVSATPGPVRINAGSSATVSDHLGNVWAADTGFTGGSTVNRGSLGVTGTLDPCLFETERYGMTAFATAVANGEYTVNLLFAETYAGITGAGQRVFTVNVEGTTVGPIDIFAQAGGARKALVKTVTVTVADGVLNMTFAATANYAEINGIEILPVTSTPDPAIRVKAGSATNVLDHLGKVWAADNGFTGGTTVNRGGIGIAGTLDPVLFRTERYGMTAFSKAVPNGFYKVNLYFAETYAGITGFGQRVFSVTVEGAKLGPIDVFAQAGGANKALVKTVTVAVTDGRLDLTFAATANNAEINAIEILPVVDPATLPTYLTMSSPLGDWVGLGRKINLTPPEATFKASYDGSQANLGVSAPRYFELWNVSLAAAPGQPLVVGTYSNAVRPNTRGPGQPGLDVFGNEHGCGAVSGSFTVLSVVYGPGNTIVQLRAKFTQSCEGYMPPLSGEISIDGIQSFLTISSPPSDWVGHGLNYNLHPPSATFKAVYDGSKVDIKVVAPGQLWYVFLAAAPGQPLVEGTYTNAVRAHYRGPGQPGLDVFGNGRGCGDLSGSFTVLRAVYGPGNTIVQLHATFIQSCEGYMPPLTGEISYDVTTL
jgi:predicted RecB family endonuclease